MHLCISVVVGGEEGAAKLDQGALKFRIYPAELTFLRIDLNFAITKLGYHTCQLRDDLIHAKSGGP